MLEEGETETAVAYAEAEGGGEEGGRSQGDVDNNDAIEKREGGSASEEERDEQDGSGFNRSLIGGQLRAVRVANIGCEAASGLSRSQDVEKEMRRGRDMKSTSISVSSSESSMGSEK